MKHYRYNLTWTGNNNAEKDVNKGFSGKYSKMNISIKNSLYRADYFLEDTGYLLFISNSENEHLELCAAVNLDTESEEKCIARIKRSFPDCTISDRKNITEEEFTKTITSADESLGGEVTYELYYLHNTKNCPPK